MSISVSKSQQNQVDAPVFARRSLNPPNTFKSLLCAVLLATTGAAYTLAREFQQQVGNGIAPNAIAPNGTAPSPYTDSQSAPNCRIEEYRTPLAVASTCAVFAGAVISGLGAIIAVVGPYIRSCELPNQGTPLRNTLMHPSIPGIAIATVGGMVTAAAGIVLSTTQNYEQVQICPEGLPDGASPFPGSQGPSEQLPPVGAGQAPLPLGSAASQPPLATEPLGDSDSSALPPGAHKPPSYNEDYSGDEK